MEGMPNLLNGNESNQQHTTHKADDTQSKIYTQNCSFSNIDEFLDYVGGDTPIRRILIANNGNSAIKAIRSMRQWAYATFRNEKILEFCVLATLDDIEANAEFISEADFYIEVPSGPNNNNYANINLISQIAEIKQCDAVWPGWGHASENYKLPMALHTLNRRVEWIGPTSQAMISLGDKIGSTIVAQSVDVPCVKWSGSDIRLEGPFDGQLTLSEDILKKATVISSEQVVAVCHKIGYPVMIKASEGGGGKGIRLCNSDEEAEKSFWQVCQEVKGSPVFVMQVVTKCRHLEVQILADKYGNTYAMGTRDCTIQRRCQKIIEESPAIIAPPEIIEQMEAAAVRMCKAVGYTNAGTCEFLYDPKTKNFYFLEVNARLQVEHVVTECLADVNLPGAQLQIAMGVPLTHIADIQRFIQKQKTERFQQPKHVIAARITAEHAEEGFRPTCGAVHELSLRPTRQVWGYFSIGSTGRIHEFSDSQFGHIFASGINREEARTSLIMALKTLIIRGEIRTNLEALIRILETPQYKDNLTSTTWLENEVKFGSNVSGNQLHTSTLLAVFLGAIYEAYTHFKKSSEEFKQKTNQGQPPSHIAIQHKVELVYQKFKFSLNCLASGPNQVVVELNGSYVEATIRQITSSIHDKSSDNGGGYLVSGGFDWKSHRVDYRRDGTGLRVTFDGSTYTFTDEIDPSQVRASMSGKLVRWLVQNESYVQKGQPFAEIELMKMYTELTLPNSGKIQHALAEGAVFQTGDLLAVLELTSDRIIPKAQYYEGTFDIIPHISQKEENCYNNYRQSYTKILHVLDGYTLFDKDIDTHLLIFLETIVNPFLPLYELNETLAVLDSQLPISLTHKFQQALKPMQEAIQRRLLNVENEVESPNYTHTESTNDTLLSNNFTHDDPNSPSYDTFIPELTTHSAASTADESNLFIYTSWEFFVYQLTQIIEDHLNLQNSSDYNDIHTNRVLLEPIFDVLKKYEKGLVISAADKIVNLLEHYLEIEEIFNLSTDHPTKLIQTKRTEMSTDKLLLMARSHQNLKQKNRLVSQMLYYIRDSPVWQTSQFFQNYLRTYSDFVVNFPNLYDVFLRLSLLSSPHYSNVDFRARQLLLTKKEKPFSVKTNNLYKRLVDYSERRSGGVTPLLGTSSTSGIGNFVVDLQGCPENSLMALFVHAHHKIRKLALDIYIRRYYDGQGVHETTIHTDGDYWMKKDGNYTRWDHRSDDYRYTPSQNGEFFNSHFGPTHSHHNDEEDKHLLQTHCPILAIWTHHALFYKDFLLDTSDISHTDISNLSLTPNPTMPTHTPTPIEPDTQFNTKAINGDTHTNEQIEGLNSSCRLHHMLRAFGGGNEEIISGTVRQSQQTIAMAFKTISHFTNKFCDCFNEYVKLNGSVPTSPVTNSKILLIFIASIDSQFLLHKGSGSHIQTYSNGVISAIRSVLNANTSLLTSNSLYLVCVSYLLQTTYSDSPTIKPKHTHTHNSKHAWKAFHQSDENFISDFELGVTNSPRYVYFRYTNSSPSPYTHEPTDDTHTKKTQQDEGNSIRSHTHTPTHTFCEESLLKDVNMCHFSLLELRRLRTFTIKTIATSIPQIHIYEAYVDRPKHTHKPIEITHTQPSNPPRYFVRIIQHHPLHATHTDIFTEQERYFVSGLNTLEVALRNDYDKKAGNHLILVNVCSLQQSQISPQTAEMAARELAQRYEKRLASNSIKCVEIRYVPHTARMSESVVPLRLVVDNPTGQAIRIRKFLEVTNPTTGKQVFTSLENSDFPGLKHKDNGYKNDSLLSSLNDYNGQPIDVPHPLTNPLSEKRSLASNLGTVYIYDFLDLFEEALKNLWKKCPKFSFKQIDELSSYTQDEDTHTPRSNLTSGTVRSYNSVFSNSLLPNQVLEAVELTLNSKGQLEEVYRDPGCNKIGMVAWKINLCTPEFPKGRKLILIGNDVTFQMGTFGLQEDLLFQCASEYARNKGIPRVYIAVNSGARMGLATEIQRVFNVEWVDENSPNKGFKYIYLKSDDYKKYSKEEGIVGEPIDHPTQGKIYKISSVIGIQSGLGVENLSGSGAIAGETSRAYNSTFTITYVTGRNVGIGAYITRLGQRVIQKSDSAPILLTGSQALNRLIGRDVYTSNDEIGGIDVMHKNGITHLVVKGDMEGCEAILDWLSYVPEFRDGPIPILMDPNDHVNRPVLYKPTRTTDDPRLLLTGCIDPKGHWLGGMFDRNTFREVMSDWAKSVITGRARLGGVPVGIINVETRITEAKQPADPAMPNTSEITFTRAGQVWYPDSAYKTAQAIWDFNKEELPLFIFANWRGFSGGQKDMFDEVLKFGSYIVDALVAYRQPVFVYIPPKAELRGGAWVVVDPRINVEHMEMYADTDCRGGVLEPTGMVEIKFREKALIETITRLDKFIEKLNQEDKALEKEGVPIDAPNRKLIKEKKDKRLQEVLPVYKQVAVHFADLHDTPVRMKMKHAIHDIIPWEQSRNFFYWRLRRQMILFNLRNEVCKCQPHLSLMAAEHLIYKWAEESGHVVETNSQFLQWTNHCIQDISHRLSLLRKQYIEQQISELYKESSKTVVDTLKSSDPSLFKSGQVLNSSINKTYSNSSEKSNVSFRTNTPTHNE